MAATVLLVQGAGDMHDPEGSIVLVRDLEQELPDGYRLVAPEMPDGGDPSFGPWRDAIARELEAIDGPVLIVGHSFGGSVALKMLAEGLDGGHDGGPTGDAIQGLFLVAVPWWGPDGWDWDEIAIPPSPATELRNLPVFLYHSVDDPHVPFEHLSRLESVLPDAVVRRIAGAEHSFRQGLPELVQDIRTTAEP